MAYCTDAPFCYLYHRQGLLRRMIKSIVIHQKHKRTLMRPSPQSLQRRPWLAWLASFVMLFHALAPVWAHAQGPALVEMCSAVGNKWVAAPAGAGVSDGKQAIVHALGHCQACCAQVFAAPLPILPGLRFAPPECVRFVALPRTFLPPSRIHLSPSLARAPPAFLS